MHDSRETVPKTIWIAAVTAAALIACTVLAAAQRNSSLKSNSVDMYEPGQMTIEFADRCALIIENAADEIVTRADDWHIRRQAVLFKIRAITECREALLRENPVTSIIDLWTLCIQLRQYLETGDGKELFGEWPSIAIDAVRTMETNFDNLAGTITPTAALGRGA